MDSQYSHLAWIQTPRSKGGLGGLKYPLVADLTKKISADYGVLLDGGIALRGLFLIDKKGVVRHDHGQRPAARPQRGRGAAGARRAAALREARRGLPGELEAGRGDDQAGREGVEGVLPESGPVT